MLSRFKYFNVLHRFLQTHHSSFEFWNVFITISFDTFPCIISDPHMVCTRNEHQGTKNQYNNALVWMLKNGNKKYTTRLKKFNRIAHHNVQYLIEQRCVNVLVKTEKKMHKSANDLLYFQCSQTVAEHLSQLTLIQQ